MSTTHAHVVADAAPQLTADQVGRLRALLLAARPTPTCRPDVRRPRPVRPRPTPEQT